jgi:hypothetical protein
MMTFMAAPFPSGFVGEATFDGRDDALPDADVDADDRIAIAVEDLNEVFLRFAVKDADDQAAAGRAFVDAEDLRVVQALAGRFGHGHILPCQVGLGPVGIQMNDLISAPPPMIRTMIKTITVGTVTISLRRWGWAPFVGHSGPMARFQGEYCGSLSFHFAAVALGRLRSVLLLKSEKIGGKLRFCEVLQSSA